jgi:hypothetical protein
MKKNQARRPTSTTALTKGTLNSSECKSDDGTIAFLPVSLEWSTDLKYSLTISFKIQNHFVGNDISNVRVTVLCSRGWMLAPRFASREIEFLVGFHLFGRCFVCFFIGSSEDVLEQWHAVQ